MQQPRSIPLPPFLPAFAALQDNIWLHTCGAYHVEMAALSAIAQGSTIEKRSEWIKAIEEQKKHDGGEGVNDTTPHNIAAASSIATAAAPSSHHSSSSSAFASSSPYRTRLHVAARRVLSHLRQFHSDIITSQRNDTATNVSGDQFLSCNTAAHHYSTLATSLLALGRLLLRSIDASIHRLAGDGSGRELLALLMTYQEAVGVTDEFRMVVEELDSISKASIESHFMLELNTLVMHLTTMTSQLLTSISSSVHAFCTSTWLEVMPLRSKENKNVVEYMIRKFMPQPLPILLELTSDTEMKAGMISEPLSPVSPASPSMKSIDTGFTPLLPFIASYLLPVLFISLTSSSSHVICTFIPSVFTSILSSFELHLARCRINPQGAARLNVEWRWIYQWMKMRHVKTKHQKEAAHRSTPSQQLSPSLLLTPQSSLSPISAAGVMPAWLSSSAFMTDELSSSLSSCSLSTIITLRSLLLSLPIWLRLNSIVRVLLTPSIYVTPSFKKRREAARRRTGSGFAWLFGCASNDAREVDAHEEKRDIIVTAPSPQAAPSQNRIAPMPMPLTLSSPTSSPSPSPTWMSSPSASPTLQITISIHPYGKTPTAATSGSNSAPPLNAPSSASSSSSSSSSSSAASMPLQLPDLEHWLSVSSSAHESKFIAAGTGRTTIVDWPERT